MKPFCKLAFCFQLRTVSKKYVCYTVYVLLKGLSHEICTVIFWLEWIYLGLNRNCFRFSNFKEVPVKLLHSHTTTQFHWSSESTICSLPRGPAIRVPGKHLHIWNWDLLLAMSRYSPLILDSQLKYWCVSYQTFSEIRNEKHWQLSLQQISNFPFSRLAVLRETLQRVSIVFGDS